MNKGLPALKRIDRWLDYGWLSHLDRAFARFLHEQDHSASDEILWAGALVSQQLAKGEVYLDLDKLGQHPWLTLAATNDSPGETENRLSLDELALFSSDKVEQWKASLLKSTLISTGEGSTPLVLENNRLYLRRYWQYQQTVATSIQERLKPVRDDLPTDLLSQLAVLFPTNQEHPDWQKIACVLALRARFSIITGGPGTGKTATLAKLMALLIRLHQHESGKNPIILLAAPTGEAAARVSESIAKALDTPEIPHDIKQYLPATASTLHRLLGSSLDSRLYRYHRRNPLLADTVIIDEASMINLELMAALLDALPTHANLILLGDKDQLASVEAGAVFGDLCRHAEAVAYDDATRIWINKYAGENLAIPKTVGISINQQTTLLQQSHRFIEHSGIGQLAKAVKLGKSEQARAILNNSDQNHSLTTDGEYINLISNPHPDIADNLLKKWLLGTDNDGINPCVGYAYYRNLIQNKKPADDQAFNDWAKQVLEAFAAFQVICAVRQGKWGIESLNRRIEGWLFPESRQNTWYEGRPVMITRNEYSLRLMNGDIGITLNDVYGQLKVAFPTNDDLIADNNSRWLSPMRLPAVETAYAITAHKSQGSEFDHVALVLPEYRSQVITRELIYTALTRAKQSFTLVETNPEVFDEGICTAYR